MWSIALKVEILNKIEPFDDRDDIISKQSNSVGPSI